MASMRIWIAGYGGPPAAAIGAIPVWIATGDGSIAGATEALIDAYGGPFGEATAVWIAGYGGPPPASIGAVPIFIGGYAGAGGSVTPPPVTSVWSASDAAAGGMTLSNGGLTATGSGATNYETVRGSAGKASGKLYVEFKLTTASTNTIFWGVADAGFNPASFLGNNSISAGTQPGACYDSGGGFVAGTTVPGATTPAINDVWALAVDFTAGLVFIAQNNVWNASSNPATGSVPLFTFTPALAGTLFPAMSFYGATGTWTLQPTAASQKYAPPSGFTAWDGVGVP